MGLSAIGHFSCDYPGCEVINDFYITNSSPELPEGWSDLQGDVRLEGGEYRFVRRVFLCPEHVKLVLGNVELAKLVEEE
jgi:hypothetical protein